MRTDLVLVILLEETQSAIGRVLERLTSAGFPTTQRASQEPDPVFASAGELSSFPVSFDGSEWAFESKMQPSPLPEGWQWGDDCGDFAISPDGSIWRRKK